MFSILTSAAICIVVPSMIFYVLGRLSADLPGRHLPLGPLPLWNPTDPPDELAEAVHSTTEGPLTNSHKPPNFETGPSPSVKPASQNGSLQDATGSSTKQPSLKRDYRWFDILLLPLVLIFVAATTTGWYFVFSFLYSRRMTELPPSAFVVQLEAGCWFVPAFFLGLVSSGGLLAVLERVLLGRRYRDYQEWDQGKIGLETRKQAQAFLCVLGLVLVVPLTAFVVLAMDCYARFSAEEIGINRFWGLGERTYTYAQVKRVAHCTHYKLRFGEVKQKDRLVILFDDGYIWDNTAYGGERSPAQRQIDLQLIAFVCKQSNKPLEEIQFREDVTK